MQQKFDANAKEYYPTATFELMHTCTATYFVAALQTVLIFVFVAIYVILESKGYFLQKEYFRLLVGCVWAMYMGGIICSVLGVFRERRDLLNIHVVVIRSLMVFADLIALTVIIIMAIGNRIQFTYHLPHHFVSEKHFEQFLGPFWMYLGAISLHITVAGNMCFLQVINNCIKYFEDKNTYERDLKE